MRKLVLFCALICAISIPVYPQPATIALGIRNGTSDPAQCQPRAENIFYNTGSATLKVCSAANTWSAVGGGGGGAVSSVFGRTGAVIAQTGDYTVAQVTGAAPLASPTFTGTVTIPTPFTLGATSVTTTGVRLNYLSAATGTTGTTSTNIVFSDSPTLATPTFTGTATGSISGNAGTASALAADPGDCAANNFAIAINASGTLTCAQPSISAGVSGLGAGVAAFLGTPSSANLRTAVTDETGTGALVFADSPALTGVPTAPTAANGTNTTQIATTAFVLANAGGTVTPPVTIQDSTAGATSPLTVKTTDDSTTRPIMRVIDSAGNQLVRFAFDRYIRTGPETASFDASMSWIPDSSRNFFGQLDGGVTWWSGLTILNQDSSASGQNAFYAALVNKQAGAGTKTGLNYAIASNYYDLSTAGTVTEAGGFSTGISATGTNTITTAVGVDVSATTISGGAAITDLYGVRVADQTGASTHNYNVWAGNPKTSFSAGMQAASYLWNTKNVFSMYDQGTYTHAVITEAGAYSASGGLYSTNLTGSISGAYSAPLYLEAQSDSSGTNNIGIGLEIYAGNSHATGTMSKLSGLEVDSFTTAGGAVTTVYGIKISDQTAGATNYAFYSGLGKVRFGDDLTVTGHTTFEGVTSTGATGTGKLVYDGTPTLVTPVLGVATATSINKYTFTTPAAAATLTIANNKTLTANASLTLTGTDGETLTLTKGLTVNTNAGTLAFGAASKTATFNKSLTFDGTDSTTMTFPAASDTVAGLGTTQTFTKPNTFNIATTLASATAANLDDILVQAATTTITGNTGSPITKLNKVTLGRPTMTDASAVTVTDAATLYIENSPLAAGSVTITNPWALWIDSGNMRFDGNVIPGTDNSGDIGDTTHRVKRVYTGRMVTGAATPTAAVTGAGTSAAITVETGSSDYAAQVLIDPGGGSIAALGTVTLTFSTGNGAYGTNSPVCTASLVNDTGSWNARATAIVNTVSTTAVVVNWDNNAVALTGTSNYRMAIHCIGK